jgi:hypothetical protein
MNRLGDQLPPKTDRDRLDELISWYEKFKPEAGKRIEIKVGPRALAKMLGVPKREWNSLKNPPPKERKYRGRLLVATGIDD